MKGKKLIDYACNKVYASLYIHFSIKLKWWDQTKPILWYRTVNTKKNRKSSIHYSHCSSLRSSVHPWVPCHFRTTKNVISYVLITTKYNLDQEKDQENSKMTSECNSHDTKYWNDMINNGTMKNDAVLLFRSKFKSFWDINNSLSHELGSERSEWASEWVSERSRARERSE